MFEVTNHIGFDWPSRNARALRMLQPAQSIDLPKPGMEKIDNRRHREITPPKFSQSKSLELKT